MTSEALYLTVDQCAIRYNISKRHFLTLVSRGDMPQPIKFGGINRWSSRVLEEFESDQIDKNLAVSETVSRRCQKKARK